MAGTRRNAADVKLSQIRSRSSGIGEGSLDIFERKRGPPWELELERHKKNRGEYRGLLSLESNWSQ